jgi:hypothetical protein
MGGATVCAIAAILSIALFGWDLHVYWYENSIKPFAETPMTAFNVQLQCPPDLSLNSQH